MIPQLWQSSWVDSRAILRGSGRRAVLGDNEFRTGHFEWEVPVGICGLEVGGQSGAGGAPGGTVNTEGIRVPG